MFDNWDDDRFAAWMAGFFDGEGCIYLKNKNATAFEISVSNTNRQVIEAIYNRLQVGQLTETVFKNQDWNNKYTWRVRTYRDCYTVLRLIAPHLVIKREKALEGMRRVEDAIECKRNMDARNAAIIEMARDGKRQVDIAKEFGLTQTAICAIIKGRRGTGQRARNLTQMRRYEQSHHKDPVQVITSTQPIEPIS